LLNRFPPTLDLSPQPQWLGPWHWPCAAELRGSNVHGNLELIGLASLSKGIGDEVKGLLGGLNVRGDTTLITDVTSRLVVLFGVSLQRIAEVCR
jgi:hypothetical protein